MNFIEGELGLIDGRRGVAATTQKVDGMSEDVWRTLQWRCLEMWLSVSG